MVLIKNIISFYKNNKQAVYIFTITLSVHVLLLFLIQIPKDSEKKVRKDNMIFKIVDITEYKKPEKNDTVEIARQDKVAEDVIETKKEIKELDADFVPQHLLSVLPVIPAEEVRSKLIYPPLAKKQDIEAIVYLEISLDQKGIIKHIKVVKDPGFGFAEAAVKAFKDIKCTPGFANGIPVPCRFRQTVNFKLK